MRIDFPQLETINAKARQERAEAIYYLIILPIRKLLSFV
jgi:hypothetical protein